MKNSDFVDNEDPVQRKKTIPDDFAAWLQRPALNICENKIDSKKLELCSNLIRADISDSKEGSSPTNSSVLNQKLKGDGVRSIKAKSFSSVTSDCEAQEQNDDEGNDGGREAEQGLPVTGVQCLSMNKDFESNSFGEMENGNAVKEVSVSKVEQESAKIDKYLNSNWSHGQIKSLERHDHYENNEINLLEGSMEDSVIRNQSFDDNLAKRMMTSDQLTSQQTSSNTSVVHFADQSSLTDHHRHTDRSLLPEGFPRLKDDSRVSQKLKLEIETTLDNIQSSEPSCSSKHEAALSKEIVKPSSDQNRPTKTVKSLNKDEPFETSCRTNQHSGQLTAGLIKSPGDTGCQDLGSPGFQHDRSPTLSSRDKVSSFNLNESPLGTKLNKFRLNIKSVDRASGFQKIVADSNTARVKRNSDMNSFGSTSKHVAEGGKSLGSNDQQRQSDEKEADKEKYRSTETEVDNEDCLDDDDNIRRRRCEEKEAETEGKEADNRSTVLLARDVQYNEMGEIVFKWSR